MSKDTQRHFQGSQTKQIHDCYHAVCFHLIFLFMQTNSAGQRMNVFRMATEIRSTGSANISKQEIMFLAESFRLETQTSETCSAGRWLTGKVGG